MPRNIERRPKSPEKKHYPEAEVADEDDYPIMSDGSRSAVPWKELDRGVRVSVGPGQKVPKDGIYYIIERSGRVIAVAMKKGSIASPTSRRGQYWRLKE